MMTKMTRKKTYMYKLYKSFEKNLDSKYYV